MKDPPSQSVLARSRQYGKIYKGQINGPTDRLTDGPNSFMIESPVHSQKNKVIRLKSRASALSKKGRQTDRQTIFIFKKIFEMAAYSSKFLLFYSETLKTL